MILHGVILERETVSFTQGPTIKLPVLDIQVPSERTYYIWGPLSERYQLVEFIQVNEELDEDKSYIISDEIFDVYGVGSTSGEALKDYCQNFIDYYEVLENESSAGEISTHLASHLERLRIFISKAD